MFRFVIRPILVVSLTAAIAGGLLIFLLLTVQIVRAWFRQRRGEDPGPDLDFRRWVRWLIIAGLPLLALLGWEYYVSRFNAQVWRSHVNRRCAMTDGLMGTRVHVGMRSDDVPLLLGPTDDEWSYLQLSYLNYQIGDCGKLLFPIDDYYLRFVYDSDGIVREIYVGEY